MQPTKAYAAFNHHTPLVPFQFERRELTATDVQIVIDLASLALDN